MLDKTELVQASMVGQIKREISIMRTLHHPNIVDLKEIMASRDKLYVVMELVPGGELFDQVIANGPFKVNQGTSCKCFTTTSASIWLVHLSMSSTLQPHSPVVIPCRSSATGWKQQSRSSGTATESHKKWLGMGLQVH